MTTIISPPIDVERVARIGAAAIEARARFTAYFEYGHGTNHVDGGHLCTLFAAWQTATVHLDQLIDGDPVPVTAGSN